MPDICGFSQPVGRGQQFFGLGREFTAPFTTPGGNYCSAGSGTHAGAEAMILGSAPIIRLEGALAHNALSLLRPVKIDFFTGKIVDYNPNRKPTPVEMSMRKRL